jgi:hypothetical protein
MQRTTREQAQRRGTPAPRATRPADNAGQLNRERRIQAGKQGINQQQQQQYQPRRLQLKRSPLAGPSMDGIDRNYAPPPRPREANPDTSVKPGPRSQNRREPQE